MTAPTPVKLFNTLGRTLTELSPIEPGKVKVYCCGPTVYHFAHIGNMRTYVFEDILVRALRFAGYAVTHVMNITDVGHLVGDADAGEDKMMVAMRREKKSSQEIAQFYTDAFFSDCDRLNIVRPTIVCKATDHINEMIALIERILANGFGYLVGGNVYFDISKLSDYGKLANLNLDQLEAGARIEVDPNKRNAGDFVLWFTKSKFEGQDLVWDSPWGRGYPGWHIECSAMSMKYLGERFDIHCGGIDHVPVHHTNEIAQSEAATRKPWVTIWMHGEFLLLNNAKMAKSAGGFLRVQEVMDHGFDALSYRYLCLGASYRTQLNFNWEVVGAAAQSLNRLRAIVVELKKEAGLPALNLSSQAQKYVDALRADICNDLNTPKGLALLWSLLGDKSLPAAERLTALGPFDAVLGLSLAEWQEQEVAIPSEIQALLEERIVARKEKNWKRSDQLRDEIKARGFIVEDSSAGMKIKKA